jgi:hypothetical protein
LGLETGIDPFLSEILRKYGRQGEEKTSYHNILDGGAAYSVEAALAWMDERCRHLSAPEWLKTVAGYAWSGIYTSAIDSIWPACFRTSWREIQPVFEEKYKPSDPRNRRLLHCTFLFGCVNRTEEEERPPLTRFAWNDRRHVAVALTRRLPEAITPLGVLAIEGYTDDLDWLSLDDLLPIVNRLNPRQTHIFSVTQALREHPDVQYLAAQEKLILHHENLATTLLRGEDLGFLRLSPPPEEETSGQHIRFADKVSTVPRDLWNQVSRSAIILDDTVLLPPPPLSADARYREFRAFLAGLNDTPLWSAYARGFAFPRAFEKKLRQEVDERLAAKSLLDEPLILHGQTGTGKTVALGALAYAVRREGKYPVLFIVRRTQRPVPSDIDSFCQWAEDAGAPACLVIWDGMVEVDEYAALLRYLTSRGRKVVLVGSCYRIPDWDAKASRFVLAPSQLDDEIDNFLVFLRQFHPDFEQGLREIRRSLDDTFLVALYRLLPATRHPIRFGVVKEVGHAEQQLVTKATQTLPALAPPTTLARAFFAAGILTEEEFFMPKIKEVGGETVDSMQELTGLVMIPGRVGLRVPLELLIRASGKDGFANVVHLFEDLDIFRWFEDAVGNIEVGPRSPLEAQLLVQARMGGAKTETAFAQQLLLEVQDSAPSSSRSREIDFAVALLHAMGPQGHDEAYFAPYFKILAETLQQLREKRGVAHPRLMLQEANLLREWAVKQDKRGASDPHIHDIFDRAESVLSRALDLIKDDQRNRALRGFLLVELASTLASKARNIPDHPHKAIELFEGAREALRAARIQDPTNYYPLDVLAWATMDILEENILDYRARSEATADVLSAFQTAELADLDAGQRERLQSRRLAFASRVGMEEMSEDAFAMLVAQGSKAGYYIRAFHMSGLPDTAKALTDDRNLTQLQRALRYLEEHRKDISGDGRCLDLLFDLWWMVETKTRLFAMERVPLPLNDTQWKHCLEILLELEATGQSHRPIFLAFLRGLALFHIGHVSQSFEVFHDVERESDKVRGRRRIIRSYLASTPTGQPQKFHGDVQWVASSSARGEVYVEEIRHKILFLPQDFRRPDIAPGDTLGEFHIAFNFLGPIADPVGYYRP